MSATAGAAVADATAYAMWPETRKKEMEFKEMAQACKQLERKSQQLTTENIKLTTENIKLKTQLSSQGSAQAQNRSLTEDEDDVCSTLQKQLQDQAAELESLREHCDRDKNKSRQDCEDAYDRLQTENADLKRQVSMDGNARARDLQEQNSSLQDELASAKATARALTSKLEKLSSASGNIHEATTQLQNLNEELAKTEHEISQKKEQVQFLKEQFNKVAQERQAHDAFHEQEERTRLVKLKREQQEAETATERFNSLINRNNELSEQIQHSERYLEDIEDRHGEYTALQQENVHLKHHIENVLRLAQQRGIDLNLMRSRQY